MIEACRFRRAKILPRPKIIPDLKNSEIAVRTTPKVTSTHSTNNYLLCDFYEVSALSTGQRSRSVRAVPEVLRPLRKRGLEEVGVDGHDVRQGEISHLGHPENCIIRTSEQEERSRQCGGERATRVLAPCEKVHGRSGTFIYVQQLVASTAQTSQPINCINSVHLLHITFCQLSLCPLTPHRQLVLR